MNNNNKKCINYEKDIPEYVKSEPSSFDDRVEQFKKECRVTDTSEDIARLKGEIEWQTKS